MSKQFTNPSPMISRQLDFGLDQSIPKYWFGNDPFKTRFFDAMSSLFPEGERFFMNCVRDFRAQVQDPELARQIAVFMRQESQHGVVHDQFNDRLRQQGIAVDAIEGSCRRFFTRVRRWLPARFTLGMTAGAEHLTAIMAHTLLESGDQLETADARVRAMFVWHCLEELEHKAVVFELLTGGARAGWLVRCSSMAFETLMFAAYLLGALRLMLKADGFSFWQRARLWAGGLRWLYGRKGLFTPLLGPYFSYYRPGFHPMQISDSRACGVWNEAYERSSDPVLASNAALHYPQL